ncbi:hypothetical protein GCM10010207_69170 [Streptomyces atratus]|nr:hypothetical protein GCM10010207_69170 [Streptomyces atratus]
MSSRVRNTDGGLRGGERLAAGHVVEGRARPAVTEGSRLVGSAGAVHRSAGTGTTHRKVRAMEADARSDPHRWVEPSAHRAVSMGTGRLTGPPMSRNVRALMRRD